MPDQIARTVTAAYVQSPSLLTFRQVDLRRPRHSEVLVEVLACGVCGFDMETAESLATEPKPIGHEVVGIVAEIGEGITQCAVGDQVILESGSFCCDCTECRNGRVDLCNRGPNFWSETAMGFADALVTPVRPVVPAPDIDPMAAVLAEPCGVAIDVVRVGEIGLTDRVLIVGAGPIGLMATAIARRFTTGPLVVADLSIGAGRLEVAQRLGADAVVMTDQTPLAECGAPYGGFDRILITAPPVVIPDCVKAAAFGGYLVFIGSDFKGGGFIQLDTHAVHFGKLQLRSSFASPALYLPQALHLLRTGVVPAHEIVSHKLPLSRLAEALRIPREQRDVARKIVVIPDAKFQD
jgi:L-iditol 2-dehydrogenase